MGFKDYLTLREGVVINDFGHEANLVVVEPQLIREFNYQTENSWSSYFIAPYQARRVGYVHISDRATHIGVTKTTPIEAGMGTDIAFLKTLIPILSKVAKPISYKEGGSDWADMLRAMPDYEGKQDLLGLMQKPADSQHHTDDVPSFQQGASNMQKVTPGISVSRQSGSWSFYFRSESPEYMIKSVLDIMKQAIKPLIDADMVDFYEIVERATGKRLETSYSKRGQAEADDWKGQYHRSIAQMKYLADLMLRDYPKARKWVYDRLNHVGVKVIGAAKGTTRHPEEDIQPANARVPIEDLKKVVGQSYSDCHILLFFLEAVKKDDERMYRIMEEAAGMGEKSWEVLYQAKRLLDGEYEDMTGENFTLHLYDAMNFFRNHEALEKLCPGEFAAFRKEFQDAIDKFWDPEGGTERDLSRNDIRRMKELSQYVDLPPDAIESLDQAILRIDDEDKERKRQEAAATRKRKFIVEEGSVKYVYEGMKEWEPVPYKHVDYRGDIEMGEFCLDCIVDREDVREDAYEQAMEKAMENVEERPSETYGQDREEVEGDIGYDYDDFLNHLAPEDIPEDATDDECIQAIKDRYWDEFVDWKIGELKEKEEEESWKYEPEPEEQDIWDAEYELAEEVAFSQKGLVIITGLEKNDLRLDLESKFFQKVVPLVLETLRVMSREKDEEFGERLLKSYNKVTFDFRDKQGVVYTVNDFLNKHGRTPE